MGNQEREWAFDRAREMTRRYFLGAGVSGLGLTALAQLLAADDAPPVNPLAPKPPHFPAKARACIFIFLEGGPSQIDLFDPKPKLNALDGQPLPESLTKNVRFAFIKKESVVRSGSKRTFTKHGVGMEFSDLVPGLAGCADTS